MLLIQILRGGVRPLVVIYKEFSFDKDFCLHIYGYKDGATKEVYIGGNVQNTNLVTGDKSFGARKWTFSGSLASMDGTGWYGDPSLEGADFDLFLPFNSNVSSEATYWFGGTSYYGVGSGMNYNFGHIKLGPGSAVIVDQYENWSVDGLEYEIFTK